MCIVCFITQVIMYSGMVGNYCESFNFANFVISNALKPAHINFFGSMYLLCISCCGCNSENLQINFFWEWFTNISSYNKFPLHGISLAASVKCKKRTKYVRLNIELWYWRWHDCDKWIEPLITSNIALPYNYNSAFSKCHLQILLYQINLLLISFIYVFEKTHRTPLLFNGEYTRVRM